MDYDPEWPQRFKREFEKIAGALGQTALRIEHVGSTSVPELAAKPVIDILLEVADSADEDRYAPWKPRGINFASGSRLGTNTELRANATDREGYVRTKRTLAEQDWRCTQDYADAKTAVVEAILAKRTFGR